MTRGRSTAMAAWQLEGRLRDEQAERYARRLARRFRVNPRKLLHAVLGADIPTYIGIYARLSELARPIRLTQSGRSLRGRRKR